MKPLIVLLSLLVLLFPASCRKSGNAAVVDPGAKTTFHADSVTQVALAVPAYPYTDTFLGQLSDTCIVYGPVAYSDAAFTFCITHLSADSLVIFNPVAMPLADGFSYDNALLVCRAATNPAGNYIYSNPHSISVSYAFHLSGNTLALRWNYYVDCGEAQYLGSYSGTHKLRR